MTRTLRLFTTNHPFTYNGGETMFVAPELEHLRHRFDRVCLVPLHDSGKTLEVPPGVVVERSLAAHWRRFAWLEALRVPAWPGFLAEAKRGLRRGGLVGLLRVWRWAAVASATWRWLRRHPGGDESPLLYSYWRGGQTLALVRWAAAHPPTRVVTRVHRYELYDEAFDPPFQPWTQVYARVDRVVAVAAQGVDYLRAKGVDPARLMLARLGVAAARVANQPSSDGHWRIVSCSSVIALKRVDRVAQALVALAARHPARTIEWTHFGKGPALDAVHDALRDAPRNLLATLAGHVAHDEVLAHYESRPVDLHVLLSSSEGLPVSIQEALAHSIPVLATDVGGVAEAVGGSIDNGVLLPADASLESIVESLEDLLWAPEERRAARRDAARRHWAAAFDAQRNHADLAETLARL